MSKLMQYFDTVVEKILNSKEAINNENVEPYIVKLFRREGELDKRNFSAHITTLLFASLDTTANTLMSLLYNMARTPSSRKIVSRSIFFKRSTIEG